MLQTVRQFNGLPNEDPHLHLKLFLEVSDVFKIAEATQDALKLRLFPYSLRDRARAWLNSLPSDSIAKWNELADKFLMKYFIPTKNAKLRNEITFFHQLEDESLYEAWERFKDLLRRCPHHASVNYVGNFNRQPQNNPYSNTYNPSWKQHPNFLWSNQNRNAPALNGLSRNTKPPGFHQQSQGQKHISQDPIISLEALIKEYIAKNKAIVQSQAVSLRNLENQMGQLATAMSIEVTKNGMECNSAKNPTKKGSLLQQTPHQDIDVMGQATLGVGECRPTTVTLQLADRSHAYLERKIEDVLVKVDKSIFLVDFIVLDFEADKEVPIILGRPFLATGKTLIDVQKGELTMIVNNQQVTFNVLEAMRNPDEIEDCNFLSVVDLVVADRMDRCCSNVLDKVTTFEDVEEEDVAAIQIDWMDKQKSNRHNRVFEHLNLSDREVKITLPYIESPHSFELKLLPSHLKYAYLGQNNTLPVIISSTLDAGQEQSLVDLLGKYKRAIGWTMANIKGINPSISYKTPLGMSPYRIVYGKACHLPLELEHKAHWPLKKLNWDMHVAAEQMKLQLYELDELRPFAYENARIYKERTKQWHDKHLQHRKFNPGQLVLLHSTRLRLFLGKLKSRWSGPFKLLKVYPHGAVDLLDEQTGQKFKVKGHKVKHYIHPATECSKEVLLLKEPSY
ncbi:hypothetical protein KPL71_008667 [Citrus sinensis]|uniref:Uncharacterized protein n=1 Tax=Citrus sinensis TaxID=2711 RepID=A0ACB8M8C8_CITSI|nr:hypothetical protein KPL71_008667 [Citrus sinensis]